MQSMMAKQMEMQRQMQVQMMAEMQKLMAANCSPVPATPTTTKYSTPVLPQKGSRCDLADDEGSVPPQKKLRLSPRHNEPRRSPRQNKPRRSPRQNKPRRSPRHNEPRRSPRQNKPRRSPRHNEPRRSPRQNKLRRSPRHNKPRRSPRLPPAVKKEPPVKKVVKKVEQLKRTLSWAKARSEGKRTPKDPKVRTRPFVVQY